MKLHIANSAEINLITAYGNDFVAVKHEKYEKSIVVLPDTIITDWTTSKTSDLTESDMARLLALDTEVVFLGTGNQFRFPDRSLLKSFAAARIGLEIMDLKAACRTYNILAAEGRKVAAALLFD